MKADPLLRLWWAGEVMCVKLCTALGAQEAPNKAATRALCAPQGKSGAVAGGHSGAAVPLQARVTPKPGQPGPAPH